MPYIGYFRERELALQKQNKALHWLFQGERAGATETEGDAGV